MSTNARREQPVFFTDRDLGKAFPRALREAGLIVESHFEHFAPNAPDEQWLRTIGQRGWIALTHDTRIRYRPNELAALQRNHVGLLVVVGKVPLPELAAGFVATLPRVFDFVQTQRPPYIAKVYRGAISADGTRAPGAVTLTFPR